MTCRCKNDAEHNHRYEERLRKGRIENDAYDLKRFREAEKASTLDIANFLVLDVERIKKHLVLKLSYKHSSKITKSDCTFKGIKILVILNKSLKDAIMWKYIDPHFTDKLLKSTEYAPSPAARFPGTDEGWKDAIHYAEEKI